jgi:hypothetical protein
MGREVLLAVLVVLLGGLALQLLAWLPSIDWSDGRGGQLERRAWLRLWCPVVPALTVAAWLGGWIVTEPDPVGDPVGVWPLSAACVPCALIFARAAVRAVWALLRQVPDCGVSTNGFVQPLIVFSPFLAKQLDDVVIQAALAHERSHARHRDPLRIWLAQLVTDLQWPWPEARRRLETWLVALELARDEEARASGADGADLAAAVLASMRFLRRLPGQQRAVFNGSAFAHARLVGDSRVLRERVSRLLASPAACSRGRVPRLIHSNVALWLLICLLVATLALGFLYGEQVMHPLLALTS